jgi:5-methylcytosine-specific restriction endonuclease McrA
VARVDDRHDPCRRDSWLAQHTRGEEAVMRRAFIAVIIALGIAALVSHRHAHAQPPSILPDPTLTPGAVRTTDMHAVCDDRHTRQFRHWSRAQADRILEEYGLPPGPYGREREIDHLIPLDLGGADVDANLWTEPRRSIEPVSNAERKDRLEWHMADLVCSGQLDLHVAQEAIRTNWIEAYRTYIGEPR